MYQFEIHFLEFGRFENRPYAADSKKPGCEWRSVFNLYDFCLFNEAWLPSLNLRREEALALFEDEGIEKLAPISRQWIFDPVFYASHFDMAGRRAADLYRDWLVHGFPAGRAPNETQQIYAMMGGEAYPSCFDWRRFCLMHAIPTEPASRARRGALNGFFERPIDVAHRSCVTAGVGALYFAVGDYLLIRGRFAQAVDAFREASLSSEASARTFLRLGDALKGDDKEDQALVAYRRGLAYDDCSIWALIHCAQLMMKLRMYDQALELAATQGSRFRANVLFDTFVDDLVGAAFEAVSDTMHSMISNDDRGSLLKAFAEPRLQKITSTLQRLRSVGAPIQIPMRSKRVVILACLDLPQCTFYRIEQKALLLKDRGFEVEVFDFNKPGPFMNALPGAVAAIFYRVPSYPKIVEAMLYARFLGIGTYYDIDDLIFTIEFPDDFESYEGQIGRRDYDGLRHGVMLYQHAISLCSGGIASTRSLAERLANFIESQRTIVIPNCLDERSEVARRYSAAPDHDERVCIFYGSGTKAHNRDFSSLVAPALFAVLRKYPTCRVVVVGYLKLDVKFDALGDQVVRYPFIVDRDKYWALLASCQINISVLSSGAIADCKSEIKWLEAAMLGIPSIVSSTATYEEVLSDGVNGLLSRGSDDWFFHLESLVVDRGLRESIGAKARELALRTYAPKTVARRLSDFLQTASSGPHPSRPRRRKRRILICNVFFSPQSIGRATRVVEQNVNDILDGYSDEFEISILSSWNGIKAGDLRIESYRDRAVYRIGTALEANMDWQPFNDAVILPAFRQILGIVQPDLVHFHCIQRLTASIVEETLRHNIPYIITVHDAWWISDYPFLVDQFNRPVPVDDPFTSTLPEGVSRVDSIERKQRLRSLLNAGAYTLAVSDHFAAVYRDMGVRNMKVCENGLGGMFATKAKVTPAHQLVLGHIGGRSVHKGAALIEIVLRMKSFENLALVMIDRTLEAGAERHEVWGATPVVLRSIVKQDRVANLYATMDVLLAPSIWPESYGLVTREALFHRTWVVTSNLGAIGADIDEGETGFKIDPSRVEGLTEILGRMDRDIGKFKVPPRKGQDTRTSKDQARELVGIYCDVAVKDWQKPSKPVAAPLHLLPVSDVDPPANHAPTIVKV